ncbi:EAL and HDOD domain-containing protein [Aquisalimonas sp.]|uniref:EAL and HDOD domain-containing protein n=1 Tax=unclassified Aquisalimonas TaxID=2644645 RepID=UPI0025BE9FF9|nr:HDOD domain-containing protein [Aquisalimonas sp.]
MSTVFVARQPVFTRDLRLYGYELLFRAAEGVQRAEVIDDDLATSSVLLNTFTAIGLQEVVGRYPALVNVSRDFLVREARERTLPARRIVLELLESITAEPQVLEAMDALRAAGFTLCLDDFVPSSETLPLLDHADIVKLEVEGRTQEELAALVETVERPGLRMLAEKIENRQRFQECLALGFHYFQGYFLSRPRMVRGSSVPVHRLPTVRLLAAIQRPQLDVADLERIIATDVGLSYRLLRYMNSAYYQLQRPMDSIRQAVLYLGTQEMRRWASLMAISAMDDKPPELISMLTVRARMCELLGTQFHNGDSDTYFTIGLFSGLDVVLEAPLKDVLKALPLSRDLRDALLRRKGTGGKVLDCVLHYETGDWDWLELSGYPAAQVIQAYLDAIAWSRDAFQHQYPD